ncbi:MAG: glycosyltransferase family A protein [Candidatus Gracilibacteria bacterium]|nr:glycosyltransferase family A protein [Candidatus Gracilibacteria bacterium]
MIEKTYRYFANIKLFRFFMSILSFFYRLFIIKDIDPKFLINIEGIKEMNIPLKSFENTKEGISGILRTKNGGFFLKNVVESCVEYFDEIIIINNNSSDNTKEVSLQLVKTYSNVKYYEYNYEIMRKGDSITNSIYSLAYFYNWCFSKANYSIVGKIDDDGLFIQEILKLQIEKIRKSNMFLKRNLFFYYWGLNFYKREKEIGVLGQNPYSGRYGDIGFYKKNKKTYYLQNGFTEKFISTKFYYDLGFSYLHLKYFKDKKGLESAPMYLKKIFLNILQYSELKKVEKYTSKITNSKCINIIKTIISNNY